jgi:hypothetical protein
MSGDNGAIQNPSSLMQCARRIGSSEHMATLTSRQKDVQSDCETNWGDFKL